MSKVLGFCALSVLALLWMATMSFQQPTPTLYVNKTDATCQGQSPCHSTIQAAVVAAQPGDTIRIQPGTYPEQVSIQRKNSFTGASEAHRIIIEADPAFPPGSVVLRGVVSNCTQGQAILLQQSKYITLRGLTITGAGGQAIALLGGNNQNQAIHLERNRIFGNGSSSCNGGITIARGNPNTLIVNNLLYSNGRNGITFIDADGGPHYLVNNTIHANQWSGVNVARNHTVFLVNNLITRNGVATGSTGGRFGVSREGSSSPRPAGITLLHNLVCGNRLGEINGPVLDSTDAGNLTPRGAEGPGVRTSSGCEIPATVYSNVAGPDGQANTIDDDFKLASASPAIDQGRDPRTLGLDNRVHPIFEADFATAEDARPQDGDASGTAEFDIGALELRPGASENFPPVAHAGDDVHALVAVPTALDGSESYDPDGDLITFRWSLVIAPQGSTATLGNAAQPNPQFIPDVAGEYVFELVVHDGQEESLPDRMTLTAFTGNAPPNARAGRDQRALVGRAVLLDGSGSDDPEQTALHFLWSFVAVPAGSALTDAQIVGRDGPTPQFVPDVGGTYVLNLRVDDGVRTDDDTVEVVASPANVGPHADAGPDDAVRGEAEVVLDGRGSFDPDAGPGTPQFFLDSCGASCGKYPHAGGYP